MTRLDPMTGSRPRQFRRASDAALAALLIFTLGALPATASAIPEPPPDWDSLPTHPRQVLHDTSDYVGKRMLIPIDGTAVEFFVWDWAEARAPDGTVYVYRYALQGADGEVLVKDVQVAVFGGGAVEEEDLDVIFEGELLVYTDDYGIVRVEEHENVPPGSIEDDEIVNTWEGYGNFCAKTPRRTSQECGGYCSVPCPGTNPCQCGSGPSGPTIPFEFCTWITTTEYACTGSCHPFGGTCAMSDSQHCNCDTPPI